MGAIIQFFLPHPMLKLLFGVENSDSTTLFLARHWALLIFLVGVLLVYGAYHPAIRDPIMVVASVEKLVFAMLIFFVPMSKTPVATSLAVGDSSFVVLYLLYFLGL